MDQGLYDVIIAGAGPAGATTALHLARMGYNIAIVDKESFPRDKVCGDGLTSHVLFEVNKLGLLDEFLELPTKNVIKGVRIVNPSHENLDFVNCFSNHFNNDFIYVFKRSEFDNFLAIKLKKNKNIHFKENFKVADIAYEGESISITNGVKKYSGKVLVGADGATSFTGRKLLQFKPNWKHTILTLQCYFEKLDPIYQNDVIEAYCLHKILPGYIWIFPGVDNTYNIGIGVIADLVKKKNLNLKKVFTEITDKNGILGKRLEGATRISPVRGGIIPFSNCKRNISGKRFLLAGDAASITNPFTGEGIGYGMNCGRIAANHLKDCLQKNDFSASFMKNYDKAVDKKFGKIMRRSVKLQKLVSHVRFINRITHNVAKNKKIKTTIEELLSDPKKYLKLYNPMFYYRIFFG